MRYFMLCLLLCGPGLTHANPACLATPKIEPDTRLSQISDTWFGDSSFRFAILLATNVRTDDPAFKYIPSVYALPEGGALCVPQFDEAMRYKTRYDRYITAVQDMAVAHPFEVVETLETLPASGTYQVATWIREGDLPKYPTGQPVTLGKSVWVTLSPKLQQFCTSYARTVSDEGAALDLRVEQRLGLPPGSTNSHFVTFDIEADGAGAAIFRPCGDPATDTKTCAVGAPKACAAGDASCEMHADFFFQQYYSAFGTAQPVEYPWTSLGYTFDWAPAPIGFSGEAGFVRVGESEFVIPEGTSVQVASVVPTAKYCGK